MLKHLLAKPPVLNLLEKTHAKPTVSKPIWPNHKAHIGLSRSSRVASMALLLSFTSFGLFGCNSSDTDKLMDIIRQTDKTDKLPQREYCYLNPVPFTHSVCEVSQSVLNEPNSLLSLQLFWQPTKATTENPPKPLYKFEALLADLNSTNSLKFAANAGMYNTEFAPIGYTVLQGQQILSLNLNEGAGNFHLMPNGVLWWNKAGTVHITESHELDNMLKANVAQPWFATQSGPMLVINDAIHPKFTKDSESKKFRNGVGVCEDGYIKFVNSREPVNFYEFAQLFKTHLRCPNALFLDGGIASALYAPGIDIHDAKNMGVMVGLVESTIEQEAEH